jgi:hypothetical protein
MVQYGFGYIYLFVVLNGHKPEGAKLNLKGHH